MLCDHVWTKNKGPKLNTKLESKLIKQKYYFKSNVTYILTFSKTNMLDLAFRIC